MKDNEKEEMGKTQKDYKKDKARRRRRRRRRIRRRFEGSFLEKRK